MKLDQVKTVAIVGSGTMGAGMGLTFAQAGYGVRLYDVKPEQLDRAKKRLDEVQEIFIQEGLISAEAAEAAQGRISYGLDLAAAVEGADFVLEAVPEKLDLKHEVFGKIEALSPEGAVLATNTSALPITRIAQALQRPERLCGLHWFNPPELVPLVEVIRGEKTAQETLDLTFQLAEKIGKTPILVQKDVPGFAGNRLQLAVFREVLHLVAEGIVSPEDADKAMRCGPGFRYSFLGQLEIADLGGLDVFDMVATFLWPHLSNAVAPPEFFKKMIRSGRLGLKSGQGFYDWTGARARLVSGRDSFFLRQKKLIDQTRGD